MNQPEQIDLSLDNPKVAARYQAVPDYWVDIPEAKPRCRVQSKDTETHPVVVFTDGRVQYGDGVEYDDYADTPEMKDEIQ